MVNHTNPDVIRTVRQTTATPNPVENETYEPDKGYTRGSRNTHFGLVFAKLRTDDDDARRHTLHRSPWLPPCTRAKRNQGLLLAASCPC